MAGWTGGASSWARRCLLQGGGAWVGLSTLGASVAPTQAATTQAASTQLATTQVATTQAATTAQATQAPITLTLPDQVDNGSVVPVSIVSRLPGTTSIALLADANPVALVAQFDIAPGTIAAIALRIRLAQSGVVRAEVIAEGQRHVVSRNVDVQVGGCS